LKDLSAVLNVTRENHASAGRTHVTDFYSCPPWGRCKETTKACTPTGEICTRKNAITSCDDVVNSQLNMSADLPDELWVRILELGAHEQQPHFAQTTIAMGK
jgi:hypothetical protein